MEHFEYTVNETEDGVRIDKYLSEKLSEYSRSRLQQMIGDQDAVLVSGKAVKSNYKVKCGDTIRISVPEPVEVEIVPQDIPLDIVYEDEDLLVVNKPKGMVVHPSAGHTDGTLVNALLYHCKGNLSGINGELRPGIVHRIDRDTTGLLVVCKNDAAHKSLAEQLKDHSITRKYYCIVKDTIKEEEGTVNAPIGRSKTDRKKQAIDRIGGRKAVTHYRVLERFSVAGQTYTYVECQLETGRTHQIRVHLTSIHHPLLGDSVYGTGRVGKATLSTGEESGITDKILGIPLQGQTLHAGVLGFIHPRTGEYMEFSSELPAYFQELLEKMRQSSN